MKKMSMKCSTDQRFIIKEITYSKIHTLVMHVQRGTRNSTKFLTDQLTLSQPLLCQPHYYEPPRIFRPFNLPV